MSTISFSWTYPGNTVGTGLARHLNGIRELVNGVGFELTTRILTIQSLYTITQSLYTITAWSLNFCCLTLKSSDLTSYTSEGRSKRSSTTSFYKKRTSRYSITWKVGQCSQSIITPITTPPTSMPKYHNTWKTTVTYASNQISRRQFFRSLLARLRYRFVYTQRPLPIPHTTTVS